MNAETIARLCAVKMPASALREVLAILADYMPDDSPLTPYGIRSERNRRYYNKNLSKAARLNSDAPPSEIKTPPVLNSDAPPSEIKTPKRLKTSEKPIAIPPPPSSPSPPPPTSAPACTPDPQAPACAGKPEPELILETETHPTPKQEKPIRTGTSGKFTRIAEAKNTTRDIRIPKDLESPEFREAWGEWCAHRERLAADDARKPWTMQAASNCLRQCQDKGEAWALVEIRHALANSYVGLLWEQRRNPADVRSQPMLPGHKPEAGSVKKLMTEISRSRSPVPKVAPGERATPEDIAKAKAELNGQPP